MIYTIGHAETYRKYVSDQRSADLIPCKRSGGSVWKTPGEAWDYIERNSMADYSVWSLDADWDDDTRRVRDSEWNDLTRNAVIVEEVPAASTK